MLRQAFLTDLTDYETLWATGSVPYLGISLDEERSIVAMFQDFVRSTPDCFARTWQTAHVTGSALVVSPGLDQVLLTLHGKLNKWLQLGGHADGHHLPDEVAMREAEEESGLAGLTHWRYESVLGQSIVRDGARPLPFDLDRHEIPARKSEPEHYHYDVRYLIVGDPDQVFTISDESHDLRWFKIADARAVTTERSMQRQFDKLEWLKRRTR